jgi:hypothetical protein
MLINLLFEIKHVNDASDKINAYFILYSLPMIAKKKLTNFDRFFFFKK